MARPKVTYRIEVEMDEAEVRGNAMVSGDDAEDKKVEDEILARLDRGDIWAWASVKVVAECQGFEGRDYLGGCCYKNEADFKRGGYFPQMKRDDLMRTLEAQAKRGEEAAKLLARFS
jgi:hypothetical protein